MKKKLENSLKPVYSKMLQNIKIDKEIFTFCMQWGEKFPKEKNKGILFVGKATNGWVSKTKNIEIMFGNSPERIFNRSDQMKWVSNLESNKQGYNTKKSAFWRVIKNISQSIYHKEQNEWYSKIAWSNLYKVSFEQGNPNSKLKSEQKEYCKNILSLEIEILSPEYIIFLTSGWEKIFIKHLNGGIEPKKINSEKWRDNYSKIYSLNNMKIITSKHPQGKIESEHVNAILKLINA